MNTLDELERQHKAVWDVIRANAEAIAENSGDEWAELCAVADDLSDDCDPNLARKAIVEAVAAINALPGLLESARRAERLEGVLGLCADQFRVLGRLANGGQIHRIEEGGKRVRVSLSKAVSSECEISEARVRAALKGT